MIKIDKASVNGWTHAVRGMRNPLNSWDRSDSEYIQEFPEDPREYLLGPNDRSLMLSLAKAGSSHAKYRRMITVYLDITAPLYWWKEFDTYKVGTVANSCSTMHKIHDKEFELSDFSYERLFDDTSRKTITDDCDYLSTFEILIDALNDARKMYLKTNDKKYWWQMIQLLPSSYNQKRTIMLNYEVLANMYHDRKNHKLDEWRDFCKWIEILPYSEIITGGDEC